MHMRLLKAPSAKPAPPPWQTLAKKLQEQGRGSKYIQRLKNRVGPNAFSQIDELEKEMQQEIANALGRTEDKLLARMLQLEVAQVELEEAEKRRDATVRAQAISAFNAARTEALIAKREMTIHRQACGFTRGNFQAMDEHYPIPPKAK